MDIVLGYCLSFLCVFGAIGSISLLRMIFKFNAEISRKIIHTLVCLTWLPMYFYLKGTIHIIIVPLIFIAVNFLSLKLKLFKSMEREQKDGKNDFGTVYFAICMTVMSVISYFCNKALIPYGIAVFCLSFGDGAAAMAGSLIKKHNPVIVKGKTLAGAVACFIFAALGIILICCVLDIEISFWRIALLAFISSVLEVISGKYDNFAVPLGVMLTATLIM